MPWQEHRLMKRDLSNGHAFGGSPSSMTESRPLPDLGDVCSFHNAASVPQNLFPFWKSSRSSMSTPCRC